MIEWMTGDAESLPLQDEAVDGYTVAFGIRNMTNIDAALREAHRVGVKLLLTSGMCVHRDIVALRCILCTTGAC